jgi:putative PIN family toxin of toxin-antitoxin system
VSLQVVLDTNVLFSALYSSHGASYQVLRHVGSELFSINLSVPLLLEYEEVARRDLSLLALEEDDVDNLLDYLCAIANLHAIRCTWRPTLRDPSDEMVLELAVAARCHAIVTFNKRDFAGAGRFGLQLLTPVELLRRIGVTK